MKCRRAVLVKEKIGRVNSRVPSAVHCMQGPREATTSTASPRVLHSSLHRCASVLERLYDHFGVLHTSGCPAKRKQWWQQRNRLAAWKPERLTQRARGSRSPIASVRAH
jgi:hypothetical protein